LELSPDERRGSLFGQRKTPAQWRGLSCFYLLNRASSFKARPYPMNKPNQKTARQEISQIMLLLLVVALGI
jgi:hypothetical protein